MKSKFTWILTLCLAFFIQISFAQEKVISGTVVSKTDKQTMPAVNVIVKGTKKGVQTDFNGEFTIKASVGDKLIFSSVGSKSQTVTVGSSSKIVVELEDEAVALDQVVVEGYDKTRTKAKSNVSSTTISAKAFSARPNATFIQSLQGQVAGVNITTSSGQPGAGSSTLIRGVGSLSGGVGPLYVVDGIPLNNDNFRSINPEDIESSTVLLDAGATAIYGNRGANGVILIKTKRGAYDSSLGVRYSTNIGFSIMPEDDYNMMNSKQILELERTYQRGEGYGQPNGLFLGGSPLSDAQIAIKAATNTNWNKYFFHTGVTTSHDLSFSNGGKNVNTYTSFGYFEQKGILQSTDLKRFSFRSNVSGKSSNDKFNYGTSFSLNFSRQNSNPGEGNNQVVNNPITGANWSLPYLSPAGYTSGEDLFQQFYVGGRSIVYSTPYNLIDVLRYSVAQVDNVKMISSFQGSYKIAKDFRLSSSLNLDGAQSNSLQWSHPDSFIMIYLNETSANGYGSPGSQSESYARALGVNSNTNLNYYKKFGKSTFDATLFMEYNRQFSKSMGYSKRGLDPKLTYPGSGAGFVPILPISTPLFNSGYDLNTFSGSSGLGSTGLLSYFGTLDYDYDGRFGLVSTIRRDASYKFSDEYKWGTFYSFSGRWNVDREEFMEGSVFRMLKLRASYGTTGNQSVASVRKELYGLGTGYAIQPAYSIQQLGNPELRWETTAQTNFGLDFGVWNNKLTGKIDVYRKLTTDLYLSTPLSAINATYGQSANSGSLENKGIELTLNYGLINNYKGLNVTLRGNGAFNKSVILDIPNEGGLIDNGGTVIQEGHLFNEWFLVPYAGINPVNGNLLFIDKNGDKVETPAVDGSDRRYTDKSILPKYTGGFGFDADYKGFFLSTQFTYALDVYRFDSDWYELRDPQKIGESNRSADLLRAWTATNTNTDVPALAYTNQSSDINTEYGLFDASYLRLKYTAFGYNFSKMILKKTPFKAAKAYVQAENILTFTKWRGKDVEGFGSAGSYPTPKIFSFAIQLEF